MDATTQSVDQRAFKNVVPIAIWTAAWVATLALAKFGPEALWNSNAVVSWIAIALNVAVGIGWIVAHARYLRRVDDLQRKIMLDALAVALGVGFVGGFAFSVAHSSGLIDFNADIALIAVIMAVAYIVTTVVGTLRYR